MGITGIDVRVVVQRLQDPAWEFAKIRLSETSALLLQVHADGETGLGLAVQGLHLGEILHGMEQMVAEQATPVFVGADPFDTEALMAELSARLPGYTRTKAALETALLDLQGKLLGVPVYKLLGGKVRSSIPVVRIIPIKAPADMARNAEEVVRDGFRYLKIKVGTDAAMDVERVRAIRSAVGPSVGITIDANMGWTPKAAIAAVRRMEEFAVDIVEQPVRSDDYAGLAMVKAATTALVEADESAGTLADVYRLAVAGCVDAVSLKPGRLGGLLATKKAAAICEAANLRARMGMAGASRLCAAADMHLIASTPNITYACELAEFTRMESDPVEGIEIVDGELTVPELPGLGVTLRTDA